MPASLCPRSPRPLPLCAAVLVLAGPASAARAAVMTFDELVPFDTALGTLISVEVTLDPELTVTGAFASFNAVAEHTHTYTVPDVTIEGLGTFTFASVQTDAGSHRRASSHLHQLDPGPSTLVFTGSGLAWFLDPTSPTLAAAPAPPSIQTSADAGHSHLVSVGPIPLTATYTYDPVPEPAAVLLFGAGALVLATRRRR